MLKNRSLEYRSWSTLSALESEAFGSAAEMSTLAKMSLEKLSLEQNSSQPFNGTLETYSFGEMILAHNRSGMHEIEHTKSDIGIKEADFFYLVMSRKGKNEISQKNKSIQLKENSVAILSSKEPFKIAFGMDHDFLSLQIPATLLHSRVNGLNTCLASDLAIGNPFGKMLAGVFQELPECLQSADAKNLILMHDLIIELIEMAIGSITSCPKSTVNQTYILDSKLISYINAHLDDPFLSPASVATSFRVTERTIHGHFSKMNTTFMTYVRTQRCKLIAKQLETDEGRNIPLTDLILDAGFSDLTTFRRAFVKLYGITPKDYRAQKRMSLAG